MTDTTISKPEPLANGVLLERDVRCPMRDGVTLATDVYRPGQVDGPHPVLLLRTPYGKRMAQANDIVSYAHPAWFAARGYIAVVQDVRGRHGSEGEFRAREGNEIEDGFDAVQWCAELEGSSGDVGMYGMSYGGYTQLAAAGARPPALRCISPGCARAAAGDIMVAGLPRLAFAISWCLGMAWDEAQRRGERADAQRLWEASRQVQTLYAYRPLLDAPALKLVEKYIPQVRDWLTEIHDERASAVQPAAVPALYVAAWYDIWLTETVSLYEEHAVRCSDSRLLVGPWAHAPWGRALRAGCEPQGDPPLDPALNDLLLEWFDWHLKGRGPNSWLGRASARWFDYGTATWEDGRFESEAGPAYGLASDGLAAVGGSGRLHPLADDSSDEVDVIVDNPMVPTPSIGGWSCCYDSIAPIGPRDQRQVEELTQVAVYTTEPMTAQLPLLGRPRVTIPLRVDARPTTLMSTLCLVRDERSVNIARGVWRTTEESDETWTDHLAVMELNPIAVTLQPGDRLRLQVHCSSFPELAVDPHIPGPAVMAAPDQVRTATLLLRHAGSELALPVRAASQRL